MISRKQPAQFTPDNPPTIEWIGGTATLPAYVTGEGEPYRPEALFWMGADGAILGSTLARPGKILSMAGESLSGTIDDPMLGPPHRPTRVRVASPELADALRAAHPSLDVVCAPTPELDRMLADMRETMSQGSPARQSYLSAGIAPGAMASFFKAAAALFRARPWAVVPGDDCLLSVTIEPLGVRDAAMSVIGQMGQNFGFVLFSNVDDFEAYCDSADAFERGREPEIPPHFALSFEHRSRLAPELCEEIAGHGWKVAGVDAYPWMVAVDRDLVARPPTGREVSMAEAIALALSELTTNDETLSTAWNGGEPVVRTLAAKTYQGDIQVTLGAPYMSGRLESGAPRRPPIMAKAKKGKRKAARKARKSNR